jgi:hypothetical protein
MKRKTASIYFRFEAKQKYDSEMKQKENSEAK